MWLRKESTNSFGVAPIKMEIEHAIMTKTKECDKKARKKWKIIYRILIVCQQSKKRKLRR